MARNRKPSKLSICKVFGRLHNGPLFLDAWRSTGLHSRSTVHKTIKYLFDKKLLVRKRRGHRLYYSLDKCKLPHLGYEIPWKELIMTKQDLNKKQIKISNNTKKSHLLYYQYQLQQIAYYKFTTYMNDSFNSSAILFLNSSGYNTNLEHFGKSKEIIEYYNQGLLCTECFGRYKSKNGYIITPDGECICIRCGLVLDHQTHTLMRQSPFQ